MIEAAARADEFLEKGDMAGCETWHWILNAIERLQAKAPAEPSPGCVNRQANDETQAHTQHDSLKHMDTISIAGGKPCSMQGQRRRW
jgi:hypothetical protein